MSEKQETIADIIAEFRGYSAGMPPGYHVTMSWHDFRVMLNRLEAAHERELAAGGNAAKLREALTDAEKTLYDSSRSMYGIPPHLHALLARIRAALSAPPRNCDRPECRDIRAAMTVYRRECCGDGPLYPRKEGAMCEAEWLLAPATAKEGGNDGN